MSDNNPLTDYLTHMLEAVGLACSYSNGMAKEEFLADNRTQQAAILNIVVIGETATSHSRARSAPLAFSGLSSQPIYLESTFRHSYEIP